MSHLLLSHHLPIYDLTFRAKYHRSATGDDNIENEEEEDAPMSDEEADDTPKKKKKSNKEKSPSKANANVKQEKEDAKYWKQMEQIFKFVPGKVCNILERYDSSTMMPSDCIALSMAGITHTFLSHFLSLFLYLLS